MTRIEKNMIGMIVVLVLGIIFASSYVSYRIEQEGGFKQVIINAGKEVKDISNKIYEE